MSRRTVIFIGIITIILISFCTTIFIRHRYINTQSHNAFTLKTDVSQLPKRAPATPYLALAPGLLPPTNKWFSSLAFSAQNEPIYAYPLSFEPSDTGFSFGVPPVVNSTNAIFGTHNPDVVVSMANVSKHEVSGYDDLSVQMASQNNAGSLVAQTRISHGSPYIFVTLKSSTTLTISTQGIIKPYGSTGYEITLGGTLYGIWSKSGLSNTSGTTISYSGGTNDVLALFAIAQGGNAQTFFSDAAHTITGTSVTYQSTPAKLATEYTYKTSGGSTLFARLPFMNIGGTTIGGTYDTILGTQVLYQGTSFTDTSVAPQMPSSELDLSKITTAQRATLIQTLDTDSDNLTFIQTDSYYGGKELYRAAQLLQLAEQLHQTTIANSIKNKLAIRLSEWLDPNGSKQRNDLYFYYDTAYKGVVGDEPSYGSDQFNDHQFHYGYFIYAAAILGKYDPAFLHANTDAVNTLVADIASPSTTAYFPKLRVFDAYVGHSWASGNGAFTDGNNQESSSEAVNAWYGSYLWAQVTNNVALANQSRWLYGHETTAANTYYLSVPANTGSGPAYAHSSVGIVWGDKLDYSTFFSPRTQAILGIQLLPMSPGQQYLADNPAQINTNLSNAVSNSTDYESEYGDYLLMYETLANPQAALKNLSLVTPNDLDNGDSMTYLEAWVYSHQP
jgi:endo-1,3(4)-beta-glucanase